MIEKVREHVCQLLGEDHSGHGMEHIDRVFHLSLKFAEQEKADKDIVSLIALLHDVDDYKLFGMEYAKHLVNARKIMDDCGVDKSIQDQVCLAISNIGYRKRLKGCIPTTIEGKVVSDADMCDALGAHGILRDYEYVINYGNPFFDKNVFPLESKTQDKSLEKCADSAICHMFDKILKLKNLMLTESGKKEAVSRHQFVVDFLFHFFDEEDVPEWTEYLKTYLHAMDGDK